MDSIATLKKQISKLEGSINNPNTADSTKKILKASLVKMKSKLALMGKEDIPEKKASKPIVSEKKSASAKVSKPIVSEKKSTSEVDKVKAQIEQMQATLNSPKTSAKTKETLSSAIAKAKSHLDKIKGEIKAQSKHEVSGAKHEKHVAAPAKKVDIKKLPKSVFDKYRDSGVDIERDSDRKARPFGKRKSKEGNIYYEYRANRADVDPRRYPRLEDGGELDTEFEEDEEDDSVINSYDGAEIFDEEEEDEEEDNSVEYEEPIDEDKEPIEVLSEDVDEIISNTIPMHFDSGSNIDVFGYHTKHFDVCGKAVLDFQKAMSEIEAEEDSPAKTKMKDHTKYAAMFADAVFGAEKDAVENNHVLKFVFDKTIDNVKMLGIHSFLTTKRLNTSWIGLHVYEIALRINRHDIPSNIDPLSQELSDGMQYADGGKTNDMSKDEPFDFSSMFIPLTEEEIERQDRAQSEDMKRMIAAEKKERVKGGDWDKEFLKRVAAVKKVMYDFAQAHNSNKIKDYEERQSWLAYVKETIDGLKALGFGARKYAENIESKFIEKVKGVQYNVKNKID